MTTHETVMEIRRIGQKVINRFRECTPLELDNIARHLVTFVLKVNMDGGDITPAIIEQTYDTVNLICDGGIIKDDIS